ncbi:MAG: nucleotidyltransferase family protein [Thaumarchaeota archaeon]|nr:nucleotidyltransferase family protein [Nitrososphaerota archaeon]
MRAIILAGGQGLRLRPFTEDKPKPLVPVNGRPIAELQIEWLKSAKIDSVTFLCGYMWERLKEHFGTSFNGVSVDYSVEESPLGTGGAIRKALPNIPSGEENVVLMNGDVITDLDLANMIRSHTAPSTPSSASILLVPYKSRFGIVYIDKLKVIRKFEEKPVFPDVWINGGIYVINLKKISRHLPEVGDIERETFPKLVTYGEVTGYPHYGFWSYIDTVKDLQEAESQLRVQQGN